MFACSLLQLSRNLSLFPSSNKFMSIDRCSLYLLLYSSYIFFFFSSFKVSSLALTVSQASFSCFSCSRLSSQSSSPQSNFLPSDSDELSETASFAAFVSCLYYAVFVLLRPASSLRVLVSNFQYFYSLESYIHVPFSELR